MSKYDVTNKDILAKNLSVLHGATIVDTYVETDEWDAWPGLVFELRDKDGIKFYDSVVVSQDMEGNGPGVLIGLENIVELVGSEVV
tara:strand:- start:42 stop:299 length:258 start_codon:yes stop_codon:yes gene_type:complete